MKIIFYDVTAPFNYQYSTLEERGLGGTEASLLRIAHGLATRHEVYIAQSTRSNREHSVYKDVHYISLDAANHIKPDAVILLRKSNWIETVGKLFPKATHYLWMHNLPPKKFYGHLKELIQYQYTIIAVSNFHQQTIERRLIRWYHKLLPSRHKPHVVDVSVLYNPIDDNLQADHSNYDPNQMIFISASYKGLNKVLNIFEQIQKKFPSYYLTVCSDAKPQKIKNVIFLGSLPHAKLMDLVRKSFCVFYPQTIRVETFGLVYAEANAVGTPVLAHDFGAAREVLNGEDQLVNGHHKNKVADKITQWRTHRPIVHGKEVFRLSKVLQLWEELLERPQ